MQRNFLFQIRICLLLLSITLISESASAQNNFSSKGSFWVPKDPPRAYYKIECRIDTASKRLVGAEVLRFKNEAPKPLSILALDWTVNSTQTLEILYNGKMIPFFKDSGQPSVPTPVVFGLPQELSSGEQVELKLNFSQSIPIGEQDKITLTKWFPKLWWGIKTHDDYDVKIDVPSQYTLATSGRLDVSSGYYRAENVATFGLFLGRGLQVAQAYAGEVLVRCLFSKRGEECAALVLKTAVDAINFYRERFGFYPYESLDIVPGYDKPYGGYPAATSLSVIHGEEQMSEKPLIHWLWITAHEVCHMYWGEYVIDSDSPAWLWIGLGIYGDREYIRTRGLSLQMHRLLMSRYTNGVLQHVNTTVAITPEQWHDLDFDFNNIVTHGKGFSIISALANYLGKETFIRIYLRCLKEFGGHRLGTAEFQAVCEEESGENLGWFFDQWLRSNQYLSYQITSQKCIGKDGKYVSTVSVERIGTLKMPVPVVAYFNDGTSQYKTTNRLLDVSVLEFNSKAFLKEVKVDPDSELALIFPPPEVTSEDITNRIDHMPWIGAGREAFLMFNKAQELKVTDERIWFKLGLTLYDGEYYPQALEAFTRTVEVSNDSSNYKFGAIVWQGHIFDILGQRNDAIRQYSLALSIEKGQEMHHGQYGIVINRIWVEDRLQKPFVRR